MKSSNSITGFLHSTLLAAAMLTLMGCEGDGDGHIPGSSITINPGEISWTTETVTPSYACGIYHDHLIHVVAQRQDNSPLGETTLYALTDHAGNTTNAFPAVYLYSDHDRDGVIDNLNDPIENEAGDPALAITTNNIGQGQFILRLLTNCGSYTGSLDVYSNKGAIYDSIEFEVSVDVAVTQCNDGVDNDLDGAVDLDDTECQSFSSLSEASPECSNGVDDDGDGLIDTADPGCALPTNPESAA